ncbi:16S rRNA (guanine(966)-N(2))-methyltransferase RsmD [bacterium]|nr:16S rRNA (guanine(966)-N(2))-methyltransferase RsmD [bacterium]
MAALRVSGGERKGTKLKGPKTRDIRPITSMVKEYIFTFLGEYIYGENVLDLFSGTGNLGIEALSRGADSVSFVDFSQHSISLIRDNLQKIRLENKSKIVKSDVLSFVSGAEKNGLTFDIVFADPPFKYEHLFTLCKSSHLYAIVKQDGFFIIEHYPDIKEGFYYPVFELVKHKSFGDKQVSIFRK